MRRSPRAPRTARRAPDAPRANPALARGRRPPRHLRAHTRGRARRYAHVTFFFNGGREEPFEGEERELKESPKVATYDLEPKMAAEPVADAMVREIEAGKHTLLICNLAPPDMVGHTGMFDKAMERRRTPTTASARCATPARRRASGCSSSPTTATARRC